MELFLYLLFRGPYGFFLSTLLAVARPREVTIYSSHEDTGNDDGQSISKRWGRHQHSSPQ